MSAKIRLYFCVSAFCILHLSAIAPEATADSAFPQWWSTRGVLNQNLAHDYAPINQGQLKWLASKAYLEVSQTIGPSADLAACINAFPSGHNYFPVNIGQVKYLAAPFYDRLYAFGLTNALPPGMPGYYPWDGKPETNDYAMVNIGQAKYVFSFDLSVDTDGDGLPDWWEMIHGTNPYNPDTDGDGLSDDWEVAHGYDPLDDSDGNSTVVRESARQKIIRHWMLFYGAVLVFTNTPGSQADLIDMRNALNELSGKFYKKQ